MLGTFRTCANTVYLQTNIKNWSKRMYRENRVNKIFSALFFVLNAVNRLKNANIIHVFRL